jgi:hypothetical protein
MQAERADGAPLAPLAVTLSGIDHRGPAELYLSDSAGREAGRYPLLIEGGRASLVVWPRGALGPQRALLLAGEQVLAERAELFSLVAETTLLSGQAHLDELYPAIRRVMAGATLGYELDGRYVHGYRSPDSPLIWLRDHAYQGRGFRYFEPDVKSVPEAFRSAQRPDGSLPDFLSRPERGVRAQRMESESDVEFLYALAVHDAWQASGDQAWLREMLPSVERAIAYITSDPLRWDAEQRLVKRPFTIDMWDFQYGPTTRDPLTGQPAPRHWIDAQTRWAFFHGDNLGLAYSMKLIGRMHGALGDTAAAERWEREGVSLRGRINKLAWNGRFYTHMVFLEPFDVPGVDEAEQLSLSNAFNLNRDIRRNHARSIIEQYFARSTRRGQAFAEWYSIDPAFPEGAFGLAGKPGERPGEYTNGGIMPLVGGELARGAFRYGAEVYGFETLARYHTLLLGSGSSYLWYYNPVGNPGISGPDTIPSDGWGASAMLGALIEGAAGIEDEHSLYREVTLSPRWSMTGNLREAYAVARYAASEGYVAYRWELLDDRVRLRFTGSGERARLHLLLPPGTRPLELRVDGQPVAYDVEDIYGSLYVEAQLEQIDGLAELRFK